MTNTQNLLQRKSIRLKEYDYSNPGLYFITICVEQKIHRFGYISENEMHLSDVGKMILLRFNQLEEQFANMKCHDVVIMPNHIHFILEIIYSAPNQSGLYCAIKWFKGVTTNDYIQNVKLNIWERFNKRFWQKNYYEHIIRDNNDCNRICDYIENNIYTWETDSEY